MSRVRDPRAVSEVARRWGMPERFVYEHPATAEEQIVQLGFAWQDLKTAVRTALRRKS